MSDNYHPARIIPLKKAPNSIRKKDLLQLSPQEHTARAADTLARAGGRCGPGAAYPIAWLYAPSGRDVGKDGPPLALPFVGVFEVSRGGAAPLANGGYEIAISE